MFGEKGGPKAERGLERKKKKNVLSERKVFFSFFQGTIFVVVLQQKNEFSPSLSLSLSLLLIGHNRSTLFEKSRVVYGIVQIRF